MLAMRRTGNSLHIPNSLALLMFPRNPNSAPPGAGLAIWVGVAGTSQLKVNERRCA